MYLTLQNVRTTAESAISALKSIGYQSCVVGSLGCYMWGMRNRIPQDVDIVVLEAGIDEEVVKRAIVATDSRFYLVNAKDPRNTYKVLWFRSSNSEYGTFRCKVDILKPIGVLNIPNIPIRRVLLIKDYEKIPVMPFVPLLLLKTQAWWHHLNSEKMHFRWKVWQDVVDINKMLGIAVSRKDKGHYKKRDVSSWIPDWFVEIGRRHVEAYKRAHPESAASWDVVMS
ncbi:hypothetical protein AX17_005161 [Amanita inopinata Kibby_2008]|nr:hypothetical protein AX17_005161 [Amanita inopinata Kibby_2008]